MTDEAHVSFKSFARVSLPLRNQKNSLRAHKHMLIFLVPFSLLPSIFLQSTLFTQLQSRLRSLREKKNEDGEERINTCFPGKEIRVTEESSSPCAHPHPLILGASTRWAAQKNHGRAPCFFSFFFLSPSCSNSVGSDLLPKSLFSLKRRDKRAPRGP